MNNTLLRNLENIKSDQSKIMHCKQAGHNNMNIVTENSENNSIVEITHSSNYFSNLIPSSEDIFRNIPQFLDNLSLSQKGAVFHMSLCVTMLFCLFSLIIIFYGEYFITKYDLTGAKAKYPKLSKFIQLRRKFQNYYFIWNSIYILTCLLSIFFMNVFIFIMVE